MNTSTWFDALALLLIMLMSIATGVAADSGRADSARAVEIAAAPR